METLTTYGTAGQVGQVKAQTITVTETDLLIITDHAFLKKSQFTIYYDVILGVSGSNTKAYFGYYYSPDEGTTWFKAPLKSATTAVLSDLPSIIDSTSPAQSTHAKVIEDIKVSGATQFKITGKADLGTATLTSLTILGRDN